MLDAKAIQCWYKRKIFLLCPNYIVQDQMYLQFVENREIRIEGNSTIGKLFKLNNFLTLQSKIELKKSKSFSIHFRQENEQDHYY